MKVIPACALSLGSLQFIATSVFVIAEEFPQDIIKVRWSSNYFTIFDDFSSPLFDWIVQ